METITAKVQFLLNFTISGFASPFATSRKITTTTTFHGRVKGEKMDIHPCPKCNEPMDEGVLSTSDQPGYVSQKQTGMLRTVTKIGRARACPNCGYVEMYLDPKELKSRIL